MTGTAGPSPQWDAYRSGDYQAIPEDDRRRLDAAEAMIESRFAIRPDWYFRANEMPGGRVKLEWVIAALVLDREDWERLTP